MRPSATMAGGVMSGTLKKKLGIVIASEKVEGRGRIYRVGNNG